MNESKYTEHKYILRNTDYHPNDPEYVVDGEKPVLLTKSIADQLNIARATNGNPLRLVKLEN